MDMMYAKNAPDGAASSTRATPWPSLCPGAGGAPEAWWSLSQRAGGRSQGSEEGTTGAWGKEGEGVLEGEEQGGKGLRC